MVAIKTIGQVLKEKRTALGLGLSEAEQLTQVQKLYIVALETDDYKALPGEFYIKAYLKQYAERLGLNADRIIQAYDEGKGITVEDKEDIQETYHFVKPSDRVDPEEEEPKTWQHYVPIISLSSAAVLILVAVVVAVIMNRPETPTLITNDYSTSKSESVQKSTVASTSKTSESSVPNIRVPDTKIAVTGSGSAITANISNIEDPVKVEFSVADGSNIWVGMSNSDLTAAGKTLSSTMKTLSSVLTTGVTSSVISVGTVNGLTITINGQKLDLSLLSTTGPATITLQIDRTSTTTTNATGQ
ncbi:helix-turn-helix domain-containing protein [Lactococcus protaetiae]|uniref:Helix-turn-helix domain-containing protein n=1 Tax=Lactococcus protaetiae TaxID=2592653 RepID=A0A514Z5P1_9LACT|nr:RodZ family helix-turn-helix domain-containing protein [Lactococcus protaetiae]MCL2114109.1 helix-turn-helix domain-containing protein [Streptococcaceae bacterium]QDK69912.1 helix-turn-helix domain-containing protein [Lactococcus protaetiae]